MSSNFVGFLIVMFALFASVNVIMAVQNDAVALAWLNQMLLGTILIAVLSYIVVAFSTRKTMKKEKEKPKEEQK